MKGNPRDLKNREITPLVLQILVVIENINSLLYTEIKNGTFLKS